MNARSVLDWRAMALLVVIGLAVLAFVIGREVILWYFKIGRALDLLASIDGRLARLERDPAAPPLPPPLRGPASRAATDGG